MWVKAEFVESVGAEFESKDFLPVHVPGEVQWAHAFRDFREPVLPVIRVRYVLTDELLGIEELLGLYKVVEGHMLFEFPF